MSYPGNPSLSAAVKERVVSTFQQTVTLYQQGRTDDVAAGCTLLLQMDPLFDPAKKLLEKLRNPAADIDVDSLVPSSERPSKLPIELARQAMAERDFERVVQLTTEILTDDLLNDEARILGDEAREKLEAAPFVEQFARKADFSLTAGNVAAAKMELEKARALDPAHPAVIRVARSIAARDSAPSVSAPQPSFIVDDGKAQPTGRSAAQAADFGFTFEEEKVPEVALDQFSFDAPAAPDFSFNAPAVPRSEPFGGFSFDAAPPAAPPAAAPAPTPVAPSPSGEFDFSTAGVATTDDDQKKIEQYLADGDRAFAAGEFSQAIDLWSRIFLIDVTNDQASERIDAAKARRRQTEQRVEPLLTTAVDALERGDSDKARAGFAQVLAVDPRNATALEYLERLGDSDSAPVAPSRPYAPPSAHSSVPSDDLFGEELPAGLEIPLMPPDPEAVAPAAKAGKQKAAPAPKKAPRKLPVVPIAIVVGLLALGGGGYLMWQQFSGGEEEIEAAGAGDALMGRANVLAAQGKYDQAIALLQDIKPGDPQHDKALVMIADLRTKKSTSAQLIDGIPAEQHFAQRTAAAEAAFASGDYLQAKALYEQAMRAKPLSPAQKTQYDQATQQASKFDAAFALLKERKYAEAIASLEPLRAAEPQNASIQRMIGDAYFNLAATALQEEKTADAIRALDEVLKANPNDEIARRTRELAQRYNNEPKDLLYEIYVKYLPLRQQS